MSFKKVASVAVTAFILHGCAAPLIVGGAASTAAVAQDRRSAGAMVDDQTIELKAHAALTDDRELEQKARVVVTSFNGVILLAGQAPDERLKARASEIARGIPGVRELRNELTLGEPIPLGVRSRDTMITANVKSRLLADRTTEGSKIKIVTEDGTVFLMGLLSRAEGNAAGAVASNTPDVKHVIKIFEYTR